MRRAKLVSEETVQEEPSLPLYAMMYLALHFRFVLNYLDNIKHSFYFAKRFTISGILSSSGGTEWEI